MTNKLPWIAKNKPCSCPTGKKCAACKAKKTFQPQVILEEPRRLPLPITISYLKQQNTNPTTVQFMDKFERWGFRKRPPYETPKQTGTKICRWFRERKDIKERKKRAEYAKKREEYEKIYEENEKIREEYKKKRAKQLLEWEDATKRAQSLPSRPPEKNKWSIIKPKRYKSLSPPVKRKFIKEKSATVKPVARSKYVAVKKYAPKESMSNRCANCFYRACCKFYCYLNCILLIILIIVLVL